MSEDRNFAADMKINPLALNEEWIDHCNQFAYYSERHVTALRQEEELKLQLKVLLAQRDSDIRTHPEQYTDSKKLTEAQISALIDQDKDVITLRNRLAATSYQVNMFSAARQGLDHKRKALEELGRLQAQGYYSSVTVDPEDEMKNKAIQTLTERMKASRNSL